MELLDQFAGQCFIELQYAQVFGNYLATLLFSGVVAPHFAIRKGLAGSVCKL